MDEIIIRPGLLEDEARIREFTTSTFDWGDYVGEVYAEWVESMAEGKGEVYVALAAGKPVGVTHVSYISPGEAWFEGIRVHPDFRRGGIGRLLTVASIEGAGKRGARVCRAAIDADNEKSSGLASSFGFSIACSVVEYILDVEGLASRRTAVASDMTARAPAGTVAEAGMQHIQVVEALPEDAPGIYETALRDARYIGSDFCWWSLTPENVATVVSSRDVLAAKDTSGRILAGVCDSGMWHDEREGEKPSLCRELYSAFGSLDGLSAIIRHVVDQVACQATTKGVDTARVSVNCEELSPVAALLQACGLRRANEKGGSGKMGLWELRLG